MMKNAKKAKRPLRNKNKSDSLEKRDESDSDIQTEDEMTKEKESSNASKKTNADTLTSDFKLQSQVYLNRLEEVHEQGVQALRMKYRKIFLAVEKDILDLTLAQFYRLQQSFLQELNANVVQEDNALELPELPGGSQQRQHTQSPNVTSSKIPRAQPTSELVEDQDAPGVNAEPENRFDESEDDFDDAQSNGDPEPLNTVQPKHSALVPYTPPASSASALITYGSNNVMPLMNLCIPVTNGLAVTILPHPLENLGTLPEFSPSIMRGLKIIQSNISILSKAWEKQQRKRSAGRKSITSRLSKK